MPKCSGIVISKKVIREWNKYFHYLDKYAFKVMHSASISDRFLIDSTNSGCFWSWKIIISNFSSRYPKKIVAYPYTLLQNVQIHVHIFVFSCLFSYQHTNIRPQRSVANFAQRQSWTLYLLVLEV